MKTLQTEIQALTQQVVEVMGKPARPLTLIEYDEYFYSFTARALHSAQMVVTLAEIDQKLKLCYTKLVKKLKEAGKNRPDEDQQSSFSKNMNENDQIRDFLNLKKPRQVYENRGQLYHFLQMREKRQKDGDMKNFIQGLNKISNVKPMKSPVQPHMAQSECQTDIVWTNQIQVVAINGLSRQGTQNNLEIIKKYILQTIGQQFNDNNQKQAQPDKQNNKQQQKIKSSKKINMANKVKKQINNKSKKNDIAATNIKKRNKKQQLISNKRPVADVFCQSATNNVFTSSKQNNTDNLSLISNIKQPRVQEVVLCQNDKQIESSTHTCEQVLVAANNNKIQLNDQGTQTDSHKQMQATSQLKALESVYQVFNQSRLRYKTESNTLPFQLEASSNINRQKGIGKQLKSKSSFDFKQKQKYHLVANEKTNPYKYKKQNLPSIHKVRKTTKNNNHKISNGTNQQQTDRGIRYSYNVNTLTDQPQNLQLQEDQKLVISIVQKLKDCQFQTKFDKNNLKRQQRKIKQFIAKAEIVHARSCGTNCRHLRRFYQYINIFNAYGRKILKMPTQSIGNSFLS